MDESAPSSPLRLIMMATGPFALPTLRYLVDSPYELLLWITRPAKPAGRHQATPDSPLRELARERSLAVWEPADINAAESVARLRQYAADLFVVCDYGQILSADALRAARLGGINLHGSLLPKYRGAAPVQWAVYHGERETGVTVIHMTPKLDAGPILAQRSTPIRDDEDAGQLERRLAELGVEPVREAIELLAAWDGASPIGRPQDESRACPAPRLKKIHGRIDFRKSARQIANQIRAFQPWPGSYFEWERKPGQPIKLIVEEAHVVSAEERANEADVGECEPGRVCLARFDRLWLGTGDGCLALDRLRPAGKRSQTAAEFLRGYRLESGTQCG